MYLLILLGIFILLLPIHFTSLDEYQTFQGKFKERLKILLSFLSYQVRADFERLKLLLLVLLKKYAAKHIYF